MHYERNSFESLHTSAKPKDQKQPSVVFYIKCALKNFAKFTGKHLRQSLFFLIRFQASGLTEPLLETASEGFARGSEGVTPHCSYLDSVTFKQF